MSTIFYQQQLKTLCSTPETLERARSILHLASVRTGHGTGFVGNAAALPAVAAYLASEQLSADEVSLKSAATAACMKPRMFEDILKTVRAALRSDYDNEQTNNAREVTYQGLVASCRVWPADDTVRWMEEAEAALPRVDLLKQRYGAILVTCAVFFWVCNMIESPIIDRALCTEHNISLQQLKIVTKTLDLHCGGVADNIKSEFRRAPTIASASKARSINHPSWVSSSPKLATQSPMNPNAREQLLTMSKTPTRRRTVLFSQSCRPEDTDDESVFPETPSKKRRIESLAQCQDRSGLGILPGKRGATRKDQGTHEPISQATVMSWTKQMVSSAGSSFPARSPSPVSSRLPTPKPTQRGSNPMQADSPARGSLATVLPSHSVPRHAPRRRYRPVFLDQQQWLARDEKVERIWRDAEAHRTRMVELYGHPLERYHLGQRYV